MSFRLAFAALFLSLLASCGPEEVAEIELVELRIGILPDQDTDQLLARYGPLVEYLERTLGLPCTISIAGSYAGLVELFNTGQVDLAYFGGLTELLPGNRTVT